MKFYVIFVSLIFINTNFAFTSVDSKNTFVREHKQDLDLEGIEEINVSVHNGSVSLAGGEVDKIVVSIKKIIIGQTKDAAEGLFDTVNFSYALQDGVITFKTRINGELDTVKKVNKLIDASAFLTNVEFTIPKKMKVSVSTLKGGIKANNLYGGLSLGTMNGDINIEDIKKDIAVYTIKGDFVSSKTSGSLIVNVFEGKIHIKNSLGSINAENKKGDIIVSGANGDVVSKSIAGNIFLSNITGNIVSDSIKGRIRVSSSTGSLTAKSEKGSIETRNIVLGETDKVNLVSMEGDLNAGLSEAISGNINLKTKSGIIRNDFEVTTLAGNIVRLKRSRNSLVGYLNHEKRGKNEVLLSTVNGNIFLKKQKTR